MITLDTIGNYGSAISAIHPQNLLYTIVKRDVPGSTVIVWERRWDGSIIRVVKAYVTRSDAKNLTNALRSQEQSAKRRIDFPVEVIDKPVSTPGLVLLPSGNLLIDLTGGVPGGGYAKWHVDELAGIAPPWNWSGTWPITVSATDDEARHIARSAASQADVAKSAAAAARDTAEDALKRAKTAEKGAGVDVLQIVSDDIAKGLIKDGQGKRQGRLIHALWQVIGSALADLLWAREQKQ